ncbi:LysR family transcriptional regulator [Streptomyces sp. NPDC015220]|uniref:LysR family transcriptional regulator n=1 Tax=Streptomyces sp. NPDC015220 TaxID=3364947 RepID=UPI0036FE451C
MYDDFTDRAEQRLGADLDPRWLRAFLAVAQERHFGRAAARLTIGQPSLSRQVQQLERALGVTLFHRTPHGVTLTEAGHALVPETEELLALNARVLRTARAYRGSSHPATVTVAAPLPSPAGGLLAEAIRRFRGDARSVRTAVLDLFDEEQAGALAQRQADAVLTWERPALAGLAGAALVEEAQYAVVAAGHPLAGADHMPWPALAGEPLLFPVRERRHCWTRLRHAAAAAGTELTPVPTAPAAVLDLVAGGLGCSVVPAHFRLGSCPGLAFVPLPGTRVRLSVMWRRADRSPAVAAFVAACRSAAAALIAARPDIWSVPGSVPGSVPRPAPPGDPEG